MKKQRENTQSDLEYELQSFFGSELAHSAAGGLSDRACIAIHVGDKEYFFSRKKGRNQLLKRAAGQPDVHFWVPLSTMRHLLALSELPGTGLGTMGVAVFEHLFHKDLEKKIKFRVDASFLSLWSKGYFSVLKAGGPEVASYLGRIGFHSLSKIKETLRHLRG